MALVIPDSTYLQAQLPGTNMHDVLKVRDHLRDSHSWFTWMLLGAASTLFGVIRTVRQIIAWVAKKNQKTTEA
jgi:hypothetical protein